MYREDLDNIEEITITISVDKRTFQEVQRLLFDTNTGELEIFHPVRYAANLNYPDTPWLHETMLIPYIEVFIDIVDNYIDASQKKQIWSIIIFKSEEVSQIYVGI